MKKSFELLKEKGIVFENLGGKWALSDASMYREPVLVIPEGVVKILSDAFWQNKHIKKVIFPKTLERIAYAAFSESCVEELVFSDGLKKISHFAFSNCEYLKELVFPDSLEFIGKCAFLGCKELRRVVFSKKLKAIEEHSFEDCENLEEVVFQEGLERIDECGFARCKIKNLILPDSLVDIGYSAFSYSGVEKVVFGESLNTIGKCAFNRCRHLKAVVFNKNLKTIRSWAFSRCSALKKVTLNEGLCEVHQYAFFGCSFSELTLPDSIRLMDENSFASYNIRNVYVNECPKDIIKKYMLGALVITDETEVKNINGYTFILNVNGEEFYIPKFVDDRTLFRYLQRYNEDKRLLNDYFFEIRKSLNGYLYEMRRPIYERLFPFVFETLLALLKNKNEGKEVLEDALKDGMKYLLDKNMFDDLGFLLQYYNDQGELDKILDLVRNNDYSSDVMAVVLNKVDELPKTNFVV